LLGLVHLNHQKPPAQLHLILYIILVLKLRQKVLYAFFYASVVPLSQFLYQFAQILSLYLLKEIFEKDIQEGYLNGLDVG